MSQTILVVDDSGTERLHLSQILEREGYRVLLAPNGNEALKLAASNELDLVFLDIVMDSMDGYQTCREISGRSKKPDVPVVMVSGKKNRADKMWAEEQGAKGYVVKPYTDDEILSQLKRFFG